MKTAPTSVLGLFLILGLPGCAGDDDSTGETQTTVATTESGSTTQHDASTSTADADSSSTSDSADAEGTAGSSDEGDSSDEGTTTEGGPPVVTLETTLGEIVIQLDDVAAPITTANFLAYVETGYYDGSDDQGPTIFHRVIQNFMIQGGGLTQDMTGKATMAPIINESGNGLINVRGSIAMARTTDPDSATSQFFINVVDNPGLDTPPGYAVFGEVIDGMEIVDQIVAVETTSVGMHQDVPVDPIIIISATLGH